MQQDIQNTPQGAGGGNPQEMKNGTTEGVKPNKGTGYFPLSDLQFDVVTIVYEKSKALQAYDSYIRDSMPDPELLKIFEEIAADDRKHVEMLKKHLGNS